MEEKNTTFVEEKSLDSVEFDYDNSALPRDFDIRIEVAEQREILENS